MIYLYFIFLFKLQFLLGQSPYQTITSTATIFNTITDKCTYGTVYNSNTCDGNSSNLRCK